LRPLTKTTCLCGLLLMTALLGLASSTCPARADRVETSHYPCENLDFYKGKLNSYIDNGNYEADIESVVDPAIDYLKKRVEEESEKPANLRQKLAIVLDIDETSLSNLPEIRTNENYGYNAAAFNHWILQAQAPAIKPVLKLYRTALERGVEVFFITGRRKMDVIAPGVYGSDFFDQTLKNLSQAGYDNIKARNLFLRDPKKTDPYNKVSDYKSNRRVNILHQNYRIILDVGDQYSDLADTASVKPTYERSVKIPDPFYFIP
jgi:predicted secreted acid phosphatase